tara:strand:+ start:167 stop:835 length:669 start_codon:yes stop_codon:yes gene_type:complete
MRKFLNIIYDTRCKKMSTTSISSLPIASQTQSENQNNIQMKMQEQNVQIPNPAANLAAQRQAELQSNVAAPPPQQTSEQTNSLVAGIQKAASTGALQLPSRDIPTEQTHIAADPATRPNYVPQSATPDYISEEAANSQLLNIKQTTQESDALEWHQELQAPVLTAALYFMFQQPFIQKKFLKLSKGMLGEDGNPTLAGHISGALFFSALYFGTTKLIQHVTI